MSIGTHSSSNMGLLGREFKPLTLERDLHQISPKNITPESNIKVTRKKEMISD